MARIGKGFGGKPAGHNWNQSAPRSKLLDDLEKLAAPVAQITTFIEDSVPKFQQWDEMSTEQRVELVLDGVKLAISVLVPIILSAAAGGLVQARR